MDSFQLYCDYEPGPREARYVEPVQCETTEQTEPQSDWRARHFRACPARAAHP